ncbi:hypothetical protein ATY76_14410 [Rhizobium sp. R339]|uniref:tyrosine-type recombinase/integrase n=1 Tax=Rhizobium sp. R339 TaxID=1764273 RepID=UPI000B52A036|nr:tyrosine-type recombinase/integrase [Rhizobium sp. R339]OWV68095.1 hypothetical protein ATY76_14410 [Rhizobium sp. R339]
MRDRPALERECARQIRFLFAWAMRRERFGLKANPAQYVLPGHIAGQAEARFRVLEVDELHAYLAAAATLKSPQRTFAEGLALTGQRPGDLGRMRWSELDLDRKVWLSSRLSTGYVLRVALSEAFAGRLAEMRRNLRRCR